MTVYRPRGSGSPGTWAALAVAILLVVIGGKTETAEKSGSPTPAPWASRTSTEPVKAQVRSAGGLPVRGQPDPNAAQVGQLADNSWVDVACYTAGPPVVGRTGSSGVWVRVAPVDGVSGFVPDALLSTRGDIRTQVPAC
ncbi:MAG: hypothetical protein HOV68_31215 [Streptomycetaceae bacterium]|nr:hypothetical protein [Streptomycetaceae bacterium]